MPATVPLTSPVKTMTSARALAEAAALSPVDANVGPAIDRILRFLVRQPYWALARDHAGVLDVLHLLGLDCAAICTQWLARHAPDADAVAYWAELDELVRLGF